MGPCSLLEAMAEAEASPSGVKVCTSYPQGDCVAVMLLDGTTQVFQLPLSTGHGGALSNTGGWLVEEKWPKTWKPGVGVPVIYEPTTVADPREVQAEVLRLIKEREERKSRV